VVAPAIDPAHQNDVFARVLRAELPTHMRTLQIAQKVQCHDFSIVRKRRGGVGVMGIDPPGVSTRVLLMAGELVEGSLSLDNRWLLTRVTNEVEV
jgi:hypothetical protein